MFLEHTRAVWNKDHTHALLYRHRHPTDALMIRSRSHIKKGVAVTQRYALAVR